MASAPPALAPEHAAGHTALLIIDMISCWDFPDADKLLPGAHAIARPIAALKARCARAGVPTVYVNDNRGRWRSDLRRLVELSLDAGGAGAEITTTLLPGESDYFVLKPKQSAFFATPLELLLAYLQARRLIVTGVASDQCIWATVADAGMRDFEAVVPRDCVASQTPERNARFLQQAAEALCVPTTPGPRIRLPARRGGR
ncbi:nicotinamidase-related amidase [Variovorax sp. TBS-050B]|uniref:cysteine hydrolase family protein n=1 Tax=Variovorax sp. TBS-050B TaxID=2940551 RepID=UPI0024733584|nr:isochorismatase family cysteine hydrolase [Variovorax sp. TBS-050B]MDH6594946.1 nicotinamidase-related amidase [Variovorax sp. TBS-050B]